MFARVVRAAAFAHLALIVAALLGLAGCSGSGGSDGPGLSQVEISPASPSIAAGTAQQFAVTAIFSDQSKQDVSAKATWSSSDSSIATVSASGLAQSLKAGSTTIKAEYGGLSISVTLTVTAAVPTGVAVTPGSASIAKGTAQQFVATASFSDGTTQDVSASANWGSSDAAVAAVDSRGLASGAGKGSVTISASYQNLSGQAALTVTEATVTSIAVTPPTASIPKGTTQAFIAIATFTDGTTQNVSSSAAWSSDADGVATIDANGLAHSVGEGTANIVAGFSGHSGMAVLTVTAAALTGIQLTPADASIAKGRTQQFTATGVYTDNATADITAAVTWSSDNAAIASISNAAGSNGLASTSKDSGTGQANITATDPVSGKSGTAMLTVTSAVVDQIAITPANPSVPVNTNQELRATAIYSDSTTQDVTIGATWASADASIADVGNASGTKGLVSAHKLGTVQISATDPVSSKVGQTQVTVSAAALQSIDVEPKDQTLARGFSLQYSAIGLYSDNSKRDITGSTSWSSSNTDAATVDGKGLATAPSTASGVSFVAATLGGVSGEAKLTASSAKLSRIQVGTTTPQVNKGRDAQFKAIAIFDDNSSQDVTEQADWKSSDTSVATVSSSAGSRGLATPVGPGIVDITATVINSTNASPGKSGSASLQVDPAALTGLAITPLSATAPAGQPQQFVATGTYSDGSTGDLTGSVAWTSSDGSIATVATSGADAGTAIGHAKGTVSITAASGSLTATASFVVTDAALKEIDVTPTTASVPKGVSQSYTAPGTYTDNSSKDLTASVVWSSSDTSVATISNAAGSQGMASSVAVGVSSISAAMGSIFSAPATLQVTEAVLSSIAITPNDGTVPFGGTLQLAAIGTYSDGTTADLTNGQAPVTWGSSDEAAVTVSNAGDSRGLARGLTQNRSVTITASATDGSKIVGTTGLTVGAAPVSSVSVVADTVSTVPARYDVKYRAVAHLSDGSEVDVSDSADWSTLDPSIATVSKGWITGIGPGTTSVFATYDGKQSTNATVKVSAATLQSINVAPLDVTVCPSAVQQFTATGRFSDGSSFDITHHGQTAWSSSVNAAATIDAEGLATAGSGALAVSTTIRASDARSGGGVVGSTRLRRSSSGCS
jgi:hypothetical protein